MKKYSKVIVIALMLVCVTAYGMRVKAVNSDLDVSEIKVYDKGEKVPYEKDFTQISVYGCEGYSIEVLDKHIYTSEEFLNEFDVNVAEGKHYDYYYTVDVRIYNDNENMDTEHGINLWNIYLKSTNDFIVSEAELTTQISSLPGINFSLKPQSEKDIILVYALNDISYRNIEEVKKTEFKLMITEYPVMKLLCIQ